MLNTLVPVHRATLQRWHGNTIAKKKPKFTCLYNDNSMGRYEVVEAYDVSRDGLQSNIFKV